MKNLVWLLLILGFSASAQGVYPHQFTELTNLTDNNWETYTQKSGLPRRITPANMSAYFLKGVRAYVSGDVLYFSRRDSISSVDLSDYKQTLSVGSNGSGLTTITISDGNTVTLPAATVGDIEVSTPLEGIGTSGDPLTVADLGIATGKIADNAVTFAKIQTVPTLTLLGRYGSGTGAVQSITLDPSLSLSISGVLSASGGGGGITALTGDVTASGSGSVAATIANDAVTSAKIASQTVDSLDIKNRSITTIKIADDAITSAKVASQTIDSLDIKNRSITLPKYARSPVTSAGSITAVVFKGISNQAVPSFDSVLTYLPSTAITDGTSIGFWKTSTDRGLQYYSGTTSFLDYHGKNVGGSYVLRNLTVGSESVLMNMAWTSSGPTLNLGVATSGNSQGILIDKFGAKNSGAQYQVPSGTTKTTTYQVSGIYSTEAIESGDATTTINLPEIVSGTPSANQVGLGYELNLSVDKLSTVTINRTGSDVFYTDGASITSTSISTTGGTFWSKKLRATGLNKWEVSTSGGGSTTTAYSVTITSGNSGSNLIVVATGSGVTASYASNKLTVVIPGGVQLLAADWRLVSGDIQASADAGGVTNWVQVEFQGTGGNTSVSDLRVPAIQKTSIPTSGSLSVTNAASIDIDNNPAATVVAVGSTNITLRVGGLASGSQGYHLKFTQL